MTITIPETSTELEEMLGDGDQVATLVREGQFADFVKAYARKQIEARNGELAKQTRELMQAGMQEWLTDHKEGNTNGTGMATAPRGGALKELLAREGRQAKWANRSLPMLQAAARQKLYSPDTIGAALDTEPYAQSVGRFLKQVHATKKENSANVEAFRTTNERARLGGISNAMSERVPSEGGFFVPETLRSDMLMLALETALVRPRARVVPMDSLRVPYPTIDDPSHVSSVYGGVVGYWTEEAAQLVLSQPTFGRIVLEAKKLTAYTEIPNELMEDSGGALDQFFEEMYPEALAFFEDQAFINGDGVGQPLGILAPGATCAVSPQRQVANQIQYLDVVSMYTRMLPQSLGRAVWVCSPDVIAQLLTLANIVTPSGGTATPVAPPLWLQSMNIAGEIVYSIFGRPLVVSEKVPALGTTGDLTFVDFGYYLLGDRQTMQVANSDEYKFANDLTAFRVIERLDGRPWLRSALTPANGSSNTLSPIVTLNSTAV